MRRNENLGNARVIKIELKFMIFEFGATVVNDPDGPRVAGKPVILEKTFGVCAILRALEVHNFKKVGDGFNHGKCIELELLTIDFHRPWPDVINVNFGPWCDGSISRGQLTMLRSGNVEKSVFSIWVDLFLCRSIQLSVLSYAEMFVYMYLSQLMSTFTNYLKVHHLLDGFFIL